MSELQSIEEELEINFRDKDLLKLAFVHSSYINENPGVLPESNERLDYLGDAILGLAVARERSRSSTPNQAGDPTSLRHALVRAATPGSAAGRNVRAENR